MNFMKIYILKFIRLVLLKTQNKFFVYFFNFSFNIFEIKNVSIIKFLKKNRDYYIEMNQKLYKYKIRFVLLIDTKANLIFIKKKL